jgi:hypothetical protein
MRKFSPILKLSTLMVSITLTGCAVLSPGDADARWADYQNWNKVNNQPVTGDHTGFLGSLHEGSQGYRDVYVNQVGLAAITGSAPYNYPVGTVVVKEQYKNQAAWQAAESPNLTIMVKVSDSTPSLATDWAWSRGYGKEAKDDSFCSSCHTIAFANDFVFSNGAAMAGFQ